VKVGPVGVARRPAVFFGDWTKRRHFEARKATEEVQPNFRNDERLNHHNTNDTATDDDGDDDVVGVIRAKLKKGGGVLVLLKSTPNVEK
jgi:hypothetical protein